MKREKSLADEYENHLRDGDDLIIDTPAHKNNFDEIDSDDFRERERLAEEREEQRQVEEEREMEMDR